MPAIIQVVDGRTVIRVGENTAEASRQAAIAVAARDAADMAASSASAAGNYYTSQAAGEAATPVGGFFSYPTGAGGLIYAEKTAGGSTVIAEAATQSRVNEIESRYQLGPAGNIAANVSELEVAPITQVTMLLDGTPYNIEPLSGRVADDVSIITSTIDPDFAWVSSAAYVSVKQFGATGNGVTDDTAALSAFYAYLAANGGEGYIPPGVYKTTAEIVINSDKPFRVRGAGMRGVYPGFFVVGGDIKASVIFAAHSGRNLMRFKGTSIGRGDVYHEGVAFATLETGSVPTAAFGWDTGDGFYRNFRFIECSVHGFTSAFDVYNTGAAHLIETGIIHIERCNINRNTWIVRTLGETQINGFAFLNNEAGQNGYLPGQGGIAVRAHNAEIFGNKMEGNRDPIFLFGKMKSARVGGNYFEACVGNALVDISSVESYDIDVTGTYAVDETKLDHKLLIRNGAGPGRANGVLWPNIAHRPSLPALGTSTQTRVNPNISTPFFRLDGFSGQSFAMPPRSVARWAGFIPSADIAAREVNPNNGEGIPVAEYTTAGGGSVGFTAAIAGAAGQWVVMCWLFKRVDDAGAPADPYMSLSVNGTGAAGSHDFVAYNFNDYWASDEWCLATAAIKLGVAMTSLYMGLYPYGAAPAAGRKARHAVPQVYMVDDPNKIVPYFDGHTAKNISGTTPSTAGFLPGDILNRADATTAGQMRFGKIGPAAGDWGYA